MKNYVIALFMGCALIACDKADDDKEESIKIEIDSDGDKFTFASNTIDVISAPDEFNAKVVNNTIEGNYAGFTKAIIKSGNTTYNCDITVNPSYTYYIDMAIYLGWSRRSIEELYGTYSRVNQNIYFYKPLSSYFPEKEVAFTYDDNNKVIACASYFTLYQMTNVIDHLQQRYATYGISDGNAFYGNALDMDEASIIVVFSIESAIVLYTTPDLVQLKSGYADDYNYLLHNNQ